MMWPARKTIYGCDARGDDHEPYLTRYVLLSLLGTELCLHVFHRSDADEMHDHPWSFISLVLWGGYHEVTTGGTRWRPPGSLAYRPAEWRHRVKLLDLPCPACRDAEACGNRHYLCPRCGTRRMFARRAVTLIWKGRRRREWGFFTPTGWKHWVAYFREKGC